MVLLNLNHSPEYLIKLSHPGLQQDNSQKLLHNHLHLFNPNEVSDNFEPLVLELVPFLELYHRLARFHPVLPFNVLRPIILILVSHHIAVHCVDHTDRRYFRRQLFVR